VLRIGVLGAARIAPHVVIRPARAVEGVRVTAIAARSRDRAEAFARRHGVPVVHDGYEALLADPAVDAVYVPLPAGLHAAWTTAALRAGKHVLCEKPFTANAAQAREVAAAADRSGLVVMEAMHYRYHPRADHMLRAIRDGALGRVTRVETRMCVPLPAYSDIRWDYALGGGALLDAGCYAVHALRLLAPPGPVRVTAARAVTLRRDRRVDRAIRAELALPGGATGRVHASLWSATALRVGARVTGERGELSAPGFALPVRLPLTGVTVTAAGRRRRETPGGPTSYVHQLRAFAAAVRGDRAANLTPPADAVATLDLIDAIYAAAGLPARP
jgi:predicted dehydrogenase